MTWALSAVKGLLIAYLAVSARTDLKKKKIWWPPAIILGAAGAVIALLGGRTPAELMYGLLPGTLLLAVSVLGRQLIGIGDGLIILGYGAVWGVTDTVRMLFSAFASCGIWAVVLLVLHKADRRSELPFVPFLFAASVWTWLAAYLL